MDTLTQYNSEDSSGENLFKGQLQEMQNKQLLHEIVLLRESLSLLQPALNNTGNTDEWFFRKFPIPVWILDLSSFRILDANQPALRNYGYEKDELLSMDVSDFHSVDELRQFFGLEGFKSEKELFFYRMLGINRKDKKIIRSAITAFKIDFNGKRPLLLMAHEVNNVEKQLHLMPDPEQKFRVLLEKGSEIIAMNDWEGVLTYLSPSVKNILGTEPDERTGKHVFEFIHPEDILPVKAILKKMMIEPGGTARAQWRHLHKDGRWIWMEGVATNLLDDPSVRAIVHNFRDISSQKESELRMMLEKELSESIINSLPGIFCMFDKDGKLLKWNKNVLKVTGFKRVEVYDMLPVDFFEESEKETINYKIKEVFANGSAEVETKLLTKKGEMIPYYFTGRVYEFEGKKYMIAMGMDVRDRRKNEDAIKKSNERYKLVANATNDSIWDWNLLTNEVFREGKKLETQFGYEAFEPEDVDYFWNKFAHFEDWQVVKEKRNKILENPTMSYWEDEYRFLKKDGKFAYVNDRAFIVRNESGIPIRMIGASQDITDRKTAELELNEKNKELRKLSVYLQNVREEERKYIAREVHEELGQLASAIKIDVDWISLQLNGVENGIRNRIDNASNTIQVMIESVQKLATHMRPSILDDFGLHVALHWLCAEIEKINHIECNFEPGFNDEGLSLNLRTQLFRIVQESLANIVSYGCASRIKIWTKEENGMVKLSIFDNGPVLEASQAQDTLELIQIRERTHGLGGEMQLDVRNKEGRTIYTIIPKK